MCVALTKRIDRIRGQARGVTDLRVKGRTGGTEADRDVALSVHGGATHPAPGGIGLICALLKHGHRSIGNVAQLEPADTCDPVCADGVIADDRFVVAEIPVTQSEHQTIADAIEVARGSDTGLGHTRARGRTQGGKAGGRRIGKRGEG